MEEAVFISKVKDLKYITPKYKRLYFGNEFCERLIPQVKDLEKVIRYCHRNNLAFSLVTPYVTDKGLRILEKLFIWLEDYRIDCEVIVNDYGILNLINERYKGLQPVLGRLLTKQKRDPRITGLISSSSGKKIFFKGSDGYSLILTKKIPDGLISYYRETAVNVSRIQDFLITQRVKRAELDNLFQGISLEIPRDKLSASLYLPYGYITTTRFCSAGPFGKGKRFSSKISSCRKECQKYTFKLRSRNMPKLLYKKGNTLFFKNPKLPARQWLKEKGVDRLVYQPQIPV